MKIDKTNPAHWLCLALFGLNVLGAMLLRPFLRRRGKKREAGCPVRAQAQRQPSGHPRACAPVCFGGFFTMDRACHLKDFGIARDAAPIRCTMCTAQTHHLNMDPSFRIMTATDTTREISSPDELTPEPLVSVLMLAYNHEDFLAQSIEGVVQQECDFSIELLIGEDCSTDGTRAIALDYQKRYPHIIRVIGSDANVGAHANSRRIFARARGTYVAYCEGDDYWCARDKLARQVSLIDGHDEIGIVHTDWVRCRFRAGAWHFNLKKSVHRRVADKYLSGNIFSTWHFPKVLRTCTILLRRSIAIELYNTAIGRGQYAFGDSVFAAFITSRFKVAYVPAVMAVYHVSPNSALRSGAASRVRFYRCALRFDTDARAFFAGKADYGPGYRWDSAAALLVWGLRAHDWSAVKDAIVDFCRHFSLGEFITVGMKTIALRVPTLRRQRREIPRDPIGQDGRGE